jgi:putative two-component system response regulator
MIVNEKSLIESSKIGCFPTVDDLCATLPRSVRMHMKVVGKYANILYQYLAESDKKDMLYDMGEEFGQYSEEIFALHDIGRHYIPFELLNKVEGLNEEEKQIIKNHTVNAHRAIQSIYIQPFPKEITKQWEKIALYHHERYDGKGYPEGLCKEEIPIGARICAIADTYDGIVSWKPYKKKQTTKQEAIRIIEKESGGQFQPELVEVFKRCVNRF